MGVGKSAVGARLAADLARPLIDSDAELAARGESAAEIARSQGVGALHRLECELLLDALATPRPAVVAAAAGVVDLQECRQALRAASVAWLRAGPELLASRVGRAAHRRDLGDDPVGAFASLERHRSALYREVADIAVDVDDLTVDEICRRVRSALPPRG
jgi:shikimate kinase